jgi:hypothetical protein
MSESWSSPSLDLSTREMVFVNTARYMPNIRARHEFIKHCIRYKRMLSCVRTHFLSNTCRKYTHVPVLLTNYEGNSITGTIYLTTRQTSVVCVRTGVLESWTGDMVFNVCDTISNLSSMTKIGITYSITIPVVRSRYLQEIREVLHDDCSAVVFSYI